MSDPIDWGTRNYSLSSAPVPVHPTVGYPSPVGAPNPRAPKRSHALVATLAIVAALFVASAVTIVGLLLRSDRQSAGVTSPTPASVTSVFAASGYLLLQDSPGVLNLDDVTCRGMRGYDDLAPGGQVVITDEHQTVLGAGILGTGQLIGSGVTRQCQFSWVVQGVPSGHTLYGVSITHRGTLQATEAELRRGDLVLTIG